jgi:hypothetical protein
MDLNNIHEDITRILYKIEEQYSHILQRNDRIPILDVDLVLKDVSSLYECFIDLRTIAEHQRKKALQGEKAVAAIKEPEKAQKEKDEKEQQKTEKDNAEKESTASVPVVKSAPEKADVATENAAAVSVSVETPAAKLVTEPQPVNIAWQKTFDASTENPEDISKTAPSPVNTPVPPVPPQVTAPKVDLLKEREKDFVPTVRKIEFKPETTAQDPKKESIFDKAASLYDKIAKPAEKTVAAQAGKQPVSNIKSSIGINEKFIYLKDLFRNNVNEYNDALDKLNNFDSYADAEDYFQELKAKYNWDPEGKSFQGLAELLNRRYLHNA